MGYTFGLDDVYRRHEMNVPHFATISGAANETVAAASEVLLNLSDTISGINLDDDGDDILVHYGGGIQVLSAGWYRVSGRVMLASITSGIVQVGAFIRTKRAGSIVSRYAQQNRLWTAGRTDIDHALITGDKILYLQTATVIYLGVAAYGSGSAEVYELDDSTSLTVEGIWIPGAY